MQCAYALILFLAILMRKSLHTLLKRQQKTLHCYHTSGATLAPSRLCLVRESSYPYVHIVLALRLPGVTVGYYSSIFVFYVQCCCGVSQPSSNVAREIRISQEPQSF